MTRIRMHISKVKLPFYPPGEVKYRLQNEVSTFMFSKFVHPTCLIKCLGAMGLLSLRLLIWDLLFF